MYRIHHHIVALICLMLLPAGLSAQRIDRKVVNASGGPATPGNRQLIYNMGEPFTGTANGSGIRLTQGFLQPVRPAMTPITGDTVLCMGATAALANATGGGTWSSSNSAVATVDAWGIVTGTGGGTATIAYVTSTANTWTVITINAAPSAGAITGAATTYLGNTTQLSNAVAGGAWTSSNTAVATVSSTGLVTGTGIGTATISYVVSGTCGSNAATLVVSVGPVPVHVSGAATICPGGAFTLAADIAGGAWVSANPAIATVNAASGLVSGVAPGTVSITYTVGLVSASAVATVLPVPAIAAITGYPWASSISPTNVTALSNATAGGVWSSSSPAIASVSATGVVTGISPGTSIVSYTVNGAFCPATVTTAVTIGATQNAIRMDGFHDYVTIPNNPAFETNTGTVELWARPSWVAGTVPAAGNPCIVMMRNDGPTRYSFHIANTLNSIGMWNGSSYNTVPYTFNTGTWYHLAFVYSTTNVAIYINGTFIGNTGNGINASGTGYPITMGTAGAAANFEPFLGDMDELRIWNYARTEAQIRDNRNCDVPIQAGLAGYYRFNEGIANGNNAGLVVRDYSGNNRCGTTVNMTMSGTASNYVPGIMGSCDVIALTPGAITGTPVVCPGTTSQLANVAPGGVWASSNAAIASVSATGLVAGVSYGTAIISYTRNCYTATAVVTVTALPNAGAITGAATVMTAQTAALATSGAGGTWSSSNPAIATVGSTGMVSGIATGTVTISYTAANACTTVYATKEMTVIPSFTTPITGTRTACIGNTTTLANATAGGVWASDNAGVAAIDAAGVVTGVSGGTATISYTFSGTTATAVVTVYTAPATAFITGVPTVCTGSSLSLSANMSGGTWLSGNSSLATVDSGGLVTGVSAGTVAISYALTNECATSIATIDLTVNPTPTATSLLADGQPLICVGGTGSLGVTVPGGTWLSSATGIATAGLSTGLISGIAAGTATISYKVANTCGTATHTRTVTVSPLPTMGTIVGPATVCMGSTLALAISTPGGTWSTTTPGVATIGATGVVAPAAPGIALITYTAGNACATLTATRAVTVIALPDAGSISGVASICKTTTATFTATVAGGTWSTSAGGAAITAGGVVTGITAGAYTISYRQSNSCGMVAATQPLTVIAAPAVPALTGAAAVCEGAATPFSPGMPGGDWSSSNAAIAAVSTSGVVSGVGAGAALISYTVSNSCGSTTVSRAVTVNPLPVAGGITGAASVVAGNTASLYSTAAGGTWSSSHTAVATISAAGTVAAIAPGTTTISYHVSNSCGAAAATATITVDASPATLSGTLTVCTGAVTTLANPIAGGTWGSSNTAVATVNASGVVAGIAAGTAVISYNTGSGSITGIVTVNASPATYAGSTTVCAGSILNLSIGIPGCSWAVSNAALATVNSDGALTGIAAGAVTVTYTNPSGCAKAIAMAVDPAVAAIENLASACVGDTLYLDNATPGGTWSSSNTTAATINAATGILAVTGSGSATVSYKVSPGCYAAASLAIGTPPAITGNLVVCTGNAGTLSSSGGEWSSSDETIATIGSATATTGTLTGIAAGTAVISYTGPSGCVRTAVVTVTAPSAIAGEDLVCIGGSITLSNTMSGGTWSSGSANASVGVNTGVATGLAAGVATITYRAGTGSCFATKAITVSAQPAAAITGPSSVCVGASVTMGHATPLGTWASSNTIRATVDPATGLVTGIAAGTATISYFTGSSCYRTQVITVLPPSMPVSGTLKVCEGSTTTVSSATAGGTWSTASSAIATVVPSSGLVTGVAAGTVFVVYTLGSGCGAAAIVTVNPLPSAIAAASGSICIGATDTYTSLPAGGTWTTSAGIYATVGAATGVVTGVAAGTPRITYTIPTGCYRTRTVTVNALPGNITGTGVVNELSSVTMGTVSTGGTWSSSNTSVATIGSASGLLTGVLAGNATVTYRFSSTGCFRTRVVTVNPFGTRAAMPGTGSIAGARIYPSPTSGALTVEAPVNGTFTVYTLDGKMIETYEILTPATAVSLPRDLAAGVYMCRFSGDDGSIIVARIVFAP